MDINQYEETGKRIPVSTEELVAFSYQKLEDYDRAIKSIGSKPNYNPYIEPILFTTKQGKLIKVPMDIQQKVVADWIAQKNKNVITELPVDQNKDIDKEEVNKQINKQINEKIYIIKEDNKYSTLFVICILVMLFLGLLVYMRNGSISPISSNYYLN